MFEKLIVHNNPNIDLVNDNEYKKLVKFCLFILKILSQKPNSDVNHGSLLCCKLAKRNKNALQSERRSIEG